jgi:hypothetical protein
MVLSVNEQVYPPGISVPIAPAVFSASQPRIHDAPSGDDYDDTIRSAAAARWQSFTLWNWDMAIADRNTMAQSEGWC